MRNRSSVARVLALLLFLVPADVLAHIGSPDVYFEGNAGPYRLLVTVRLPQVVPGVAQIEIRSESQDLTEVHIVPLRLTGPGSNLPPSPDLALRSKDDPQFFSGSLWLMEGGSLQVRMLTDGARGRGEVAVPVPSVAQRVLPMQKTLGVALFSFLLILAGGAVSIAAAGAREGELEPGKMPGWRENRRARMVTLVSLAAVASVIYLGGSWWHAEADTYRNNIYQPPRLSTSLEPGGRLVLHAQPSRISFGFRGRAARSRMDDLIPDHGHLVHLFLVRIPQMDRFWHLHPEQAGAGNFVDDLPAIPPGRYRLFADIVHQSGFPETMTGDVDLPGLPGRALKADDCSWSGEPISEIAAHSTESPLPDGGRMLWVDDGSAGPLRANRAISFRFVVQDQHGRPARDLEPYMGMAAHAEFMRADGSVFAHVHPAGSVSMAALELAQSTLMQAPGSEIENPKVGGHSGMTMPIGRVSPEISFPYGFPKTGLYRIFVQIKRAGRIQTGAFDAAVN